MSRKFIAVLDTETAPIKGCPNDGNAHPELSRVYDFGYIIVAKNGDETPMVERSFVIADTFTDTALMNSAYYADKLPQYREGANFKFGAEWNVVSFLDAYQTFKRDCKTYGVSEVWAYNARFDLVALNTTVEAYSNGFVRYFTPYDCKWRDVWGAASCITGTGKYVDWAYEHGFTTEKGNPKTNVETVIAYLDGDTSFVERHTALDDARHELRILRECVKRHAKQPEKLGNGWRKAAQIAANKGYK